MISRRLRPLAAALALVALTGVGCGSGSAENGATGATASTTSTGAKKPTTGREKAIKFAQCMRDNGVSAFPDPNASGELTIDEIANGTSLDPNSAAFKQASNACKDLESPGFTGHKRGAREQANALKFAQCIRENGVKDFPDPTPETPLVDTNRIPSAAANGGMTILNAAMQKCGAEFADKLGLGSR